MSAAGTNLTGAAALERLESLKIGDRLELESAGVPEWSIPATVSSATITAENLEPIRADAGEQIRRGAATLRILEELERCSRCNGTGAAPSSVAAAAAAGAVAPCGDCNGRGRR